MKQKEKKCKGTGKAVGSGCDTLTMFRKYGLCKKCYTGWLLNTTEGKKVLERQSFSAVKKGKQIKRKSWEERKRKMDVIANTGKYKQTLQNEINKLSRMIDDKFGYGCISCHVSHGVQFAGGHRFSVGSNASLRYNLHNIHKQCNLKCNNHLSGNPEGYDQGLVMRYGRNYVEKVKSLKRDYPYIGLKETDYPELIKNTRAIIRQFDSYRFTSGSHAREMCNKLIGIYK